jgi:hypothetical protein
MKYRTLHLERITVDGATLGEDLKIRSFEKLKDGRFRFVLWDGRIRTEPSEGLVIQELVNGRWEMPAEIN